MSSTPPPSGARQAISAVAVSPPARDEHFGFALVLQARLVCTAVVWPSTTVAAGPWESADLAATSDRPRPRMAIALGRALPALSGGRSSP
jgi:hypothetical protein